MLAPADPGLGAHQPTCTLLVHQEARKTVSEMRMRQVQIWVRCVHLGGSGGILRRPRANWPQWLLEGIDEILSKVRAERPRQLHGPFQGVLSLLQQKSLLVPAQGPKFDEVHHLREADSRMLIRIWSS